MHPHNLPEISKCSPLNGKYVFVRASLNVPIKDGVVLNEFRILKSLSTITYLREQGAKIILCSHLGKNGSASLQPVCEVLRKHMPVHFSPEVVGETTTSLRNALQDGEVLLLENVRKDNRETKNDVQFAEELASLADIFVNDDFATSHRTHASLSAICAFIPSYVGIHFVREYEALSKVMKPQSPSLFILGGSKFETKMPLVKKYLTIYDHVFISGALANDFFKGKGMEVGTSLVSNVSLQNNALLKNPKILLPTDVTVWDGMHRRITVPSDVRIGEAMLDCGPKTIEMLSEFIDDANTILWNGPLGNYEGGFAEQTLSCAKRIADSSADSVIGGGDTVAAVEELHNQDDYTFVSTAGGAMLMFLELGSLPALDALLASKT